ncbi:Hypothetical protein POVR1_LOCUS307 [uncultured virus]|nr:Hypothetical protein POVR1_LOCUS307 [uncultured virus]
MNALVINGKVYTFQIDLTNFKLIVDLLRDDVSVSSFTIPNVSDDSVRHFVGYVNRQSVPLRANIYEIAIIVDYFQYKNLQDLENVITRDHDKIERAKYLFYTRNKIKPVYSIILLPDDVVRFVKEGWNLFDVIHYLPDMMPFYFYTLIPGNTKVSESFRIAPRQVFKERLHGSIKTKFFKDFAEDFPPGVEYGITGLILGLCLNTDLDIHSMPAIPLLVSFYGDQSKRLRNKYLETVKKREYGIMEMFPDIYYLFVPGSERYMILGKPLKTHSDFLAQCTFGIGYCDQLVGDQLSHDGKLFSDKRWILAMETGMSDTLGNLLSYIGLDWSRQKAAIYLNSSDRGDSENDGMNILNFSGQSACTDIEHRYIKYQKGMTPDRLKYLVTNVLKINHEI